MRVLFVSSSNNDFLQIAPIAAALDGHNQQADSENDVIEYALVYTGRYDERELPHTFFEGLGLHKPDLDLGVDSGSPGEQTGRIMIYFDKVCIDECPDIVAVPGDSDASVACALAAAKRHITIVHLEAGLRSFDDDEPEETNRLLLSRLAHIHCTPTKEARQNLIEEGVPKERIHMVGSIIIDSLLNLLPAAEESTIHQDFRAAGPYALLVLYKPSYVHTRTGMYTLLESLSRVARTVSVIFPAHPRTMTKIASFGLANFFHLADQAPVSCQEIPEGALIAVPPLNHADLVSLISNASVVFTDTGCIQEMTTYLGIPCLCLRNTTEWPVTLSKGTSVLVGTDSDRIVHETQKALSKKTRKTAAIPLWDGRTGERIADILINLARNP